MFSRSPTGFLKATLEKYWFLETSNVNYTLFVLTFTCLFAVACHKDDKPESSDTEKPIGSGELAPYPNFILLDHAGSRTSVSVVDHEGETLKDLGQHNNKVSVDFSEGDCPVPQSPCPIRRPIQDWPKVAYSKASGEIAVYASGEISVYDSENYELRRSLKNQERAIDHLFFDTHQRLTAVKGIRVWQPEGKVSDGIEIVENVFHGRFGLTISPICECLVVQDFSLNTATSIKLPEPVTSNNTVHADISKDGGKVTLRSSSWTKSYLLDRATGEVFGEGSGILGFYGSDLMLRRGGVIDYKNQMTPLTTRMLDIDGAIVSYTLSDSNPIAGFVTYRDRTIWIEFWDLEEQSLLFQAEASSPELLLIEGR